MLLASFALSIVLRHVANGRRAIEAEFEVAVGARSVVVGGRLGVVKAAVWAACAWGPVGRSNALAPNPKTTPTEHTAPRWRRHSPLLEVQYGNERHPIAPRVSIAELRVIHLSVESADVILTKQHARAATAVVAADKQHSSIVSWAPV